MMSGAKAPDLDTQLSGWKTGSWMISGTALRGDYIWSEAYGQQRPA